jgi:dTDP-4-dehydrorhamnose 3,5-epimerase
VKVELNDHDRKQVWVPPGFAHGFLVLSEVADIYYKCTDFMVLPTILSCDGMILN